MSEASPSRDRLLEALVRQAVSIFACVLGAAALMGGVGSSADAQTPSTADQQPEVVVTVGAWEPPSGQTQVPLWPNGAPDMAGVSQPPESVRTFWTPDAIGGSISQAVIDVVSPTMTVFPPEGANTGAAILVFPGGGFRSVVITLEGTEICEWIAARGVTCVLVKYRVPESNHYHDLTCDCMVTPPVPRALQDAQRAIRLVRSRADELNIDPDKIGVLGFSAGGYLVAQTSNIFEPSYEPVDEVDRISSRPDFAIAFFPGHICRAGDTLDPGIQVTERTPPTFLLQAWDDPVDPICNSTVYARALDEANVPTEVHLFATGGHAFGLRRDRSPDTVWPSLLENWLEDIAVLTP